MKISAALLAFCLLGDSVYDWIFDRVPDDGVVYYRVDVALRVPNFYACVDEEGSPTTCVDYPSPDSLVWTQVDRVEQVSSVPDGSSLCSTWDSGGISGTYAPPPHSVLYVNVGSVDSAGNVGR